MFQPRFLKDYSQFPFPQQISIPGDNILDWNHNPPIKATLYAIGTAHNGQGLNLPIYYTHEMPAIVYATNSTYYRYFTIKQMLQECFQDFSSAVLALIKASSHTNLPSTKRFIL